MSVDTTVWGGEQYDTGTRAYKATWNVRSDGPTFLRVNGPGRGGGAGLHREEQRFSAFHPPAPLVNRQFAEMQLAAVTSVAARGEYWLNIANEVG